MRLLSRGFGKRAEPQVCPLNVNRFQVSEGLEETRSHETFKD